MIKTLLKKQLLELNQNFFQDKKTGKAKSKSRTILSIVGFAILMIGVLGGMFFIHVAAALDFHGYGMAVFPVDEYDCPGTGDFWQRL